MHADVTLDRHATLALLLLLALTSACFTPDVEALTVKLSEECRIAPLGPDCAFDDSAALERLYERWLLEEVDSSGEEECLLSAPCTTTDEGGTNLTNVLGCLRRDDPLLESLLRPRTTMDCEVSCRDALRECGGEEICSAALVDECLAEHDSCLWDCSDP